MAFEVIVIGGGSAGCVIAARLSEDPDLKVLLLEAGRKDGHPYIHMPAGFFELFRKPANPFAFNYLTAGSAGMDDRPMALRQGKDALAEKHFRAGVALGVTDGFILAAYADFLLDRDRPQEVVPMLKDWERSDVLLLRLTLAEHADKQPSARGHIALMKERFAASALRGDKLHQQQEARFHLYLLGDVPGALRLAEENYRTQREPVDARILLEAALAAKDRQAAQPALEWLRTSGYEDPHFARLAEQLNGLAR